MAAEFEFDRELTEEFRVLGEFRLACAISENKVTDRKQKLLTSATDFFIINLLLKIFLFKLPHQRTKLLEK